MTDRQEHLARIAEGWDEAAAGYEQYYVPRFAPWVDAAVRAAVSAPLPDGPVLVPCCGTFPELNALIRHLPDRRIIGIDLSTEMVRLARERASGHPQVSVVEGDASTLAPQWSGQCAAVVSVFGLQQLPEPTAALRSWTGALRNDGRLSVVYWPSRTETDGPFALIARLVREVAPSDHDAAWEDELVPTLTAHGAVIEQDIQLFFPMVHPDAASFFEAHTRSGPLRALANARGAAFIADLRERFLAQAPTGQWEHHPQARHLVAHRQPD